MMEKNPLVSVLMTSYNREGYLPMAIESVLASTYSNWELLIVDDGSKDNTVKIAQAYAQKDNRIKVFVNEQNLGDYPNRNKAASLANGKYLKYVDADDYIYPWGLELLVDSMERFPEAGWGLCSLEPDKQKPFPFVLHPEQIFQYHLFTASLFHKAPLSAIIKKGVFDRVGGFSGKRQMSDTEMWHNLSLFFPVVLMPHGIVWYRMHESQESAQIRAELVVRVRYSVAKLHFYEHTKDLPLSAYERKIVVKKMKRSLMRMISVNFLKFKWGNCWVIIKAWRDHSHDFQTISL